MYFISKYLVLSSIPKFISTLWRFSYDKNDIFFKTIKLTIATNDINRAGRLASVI
jgi:hypothetical protein